MNNIGSEFRRLNPPTFKGGVDPIAANQWLRTMERMIEVAKVPEEEQVTCVSFMQEQQNIGGTLSNESLMKH